MTAAFFDKSTKEESRALFENCKVGLLKTTQEKIWSADPTGTETRKLCWPVQGKLNVTHLNMIHLLTESVQSYDAFVSRMKFLLTEDLQNQYPDTSFSAAKDIPDLLS